MNVRNITAAKRLASAFVRQCEVVLDVHHDEQNAKQHSSPNVGPSKHSGTLRRLSLDLTRALAEMRRP